MREQMAEHRANPACANCHKVMDSDRFRAGKLRRGGSMAVRAMPGRRRRIGRTGRWNQRERRREQLREALVRQPDLFAGVLTEKMLTYALGRGIDYRDMPAVRAIVRDAARNNYRFSTLVMGIVRSTPFQMRMGGHCTMFVNKKVAFPPNFA